MSRCSAGGQTSDERSRRTRRASTRACRRTSSRIRVSPPAIRRAVSPRPRYVVDGRTSASAGRPMRRSRRAAAARSGTAAVSISPCTSATRCRIRSAPSSRAACGLTESQVTVDLSRHWRRLRPEDRALPRGADGRRAGAAAAARPVRWREDRAENLIAACHAREDVRADPRRGRSRRAHPVRSSSRSPRTSAPIASTLRTISPRVVAMILTGPYAIQRLRFRRQGRAHQQMRQRADACADGDHELDHGRHDRGDRARARSRSDRGAPRQHAAGGRAALRPCRPAGARGRHAARDARARAAKRSTSRPSAPASGRTARAASIAVSACAAWSNRRPTARPSTRPPAFPARATRPAGSRSSRRGRSTRRSA